MRQEAFEARHRETWKRFEHWTATLATVRTAARIPEEEELIGRQFPRTYRLICHHLAVARTRRYGIGLQQYLNQLALDGHQHLYRSRTAVWESIVGFVLSGFPQAVRRQWRFILAATSVFYLPALLMALAVYVHPEVIYSLLEPSDVAGMESMYDPSNSSLGRERQSDDDLQMFGYYIYNNIGIGFRTFAAGLLFGIGSLFFLAFNGLFFGAVATHLTVAGYSSTFWSFVAGHSALELTAITIFGAAGLMIGAGAVAPQQLRRWDAIRERAHEALPLIYGGTIMLLAAAFVEAFWSSTTWPSFTTKVSIGISLWAVLGLYFSLVGRDES